MFPFSRKFLKESSSDDSPLSSLNQINYDVEIANIDYHIYLDTLHYLMLIENGIIQDESFGKPSGLKIFFGGTSDSNETEYEFLSNNMKIGILSKNERVGKILIYFFRAIIDNNFIPIEGWFDDHSKLIPLEEIFQIMERSDDDVLRFYPFSSTGIYRTTLKDRNKELQVSEMELWDINQIYSTMKLLIKRRMQGDNTPLLNKDYFHLYNEFLQEDKNGC